MQILADILSGEHSALWLFIAGQVVMFFCWMIGGGYYMGKIMSRFDTAITRLAKIEEKSERMDDYGTMFSQYHLRGEVEKIGTISQRIAKLEQNARKLDVIEERVRAIASNLQIAEK